MLVTTPAERLAAAKQLLRLRIEEMENHELDWGVALWRGFTARMNGDAVEIQSESDTWVPYSPTNDWADYGELVSNAGLVSGSHPRYDDETDVNKITGYWYSCHGYYGGTTTEGDDLREVVCCSAVKLLELDVQCNNLV